MHIGNRIQEVVREKRISVSWLADQICCTRPHVYKIFRTPSIDTSMLARVCRILEHDFFEELSQEVRDEAKK